MRVAENAERDLGIGGLALEILEVYLIVAVALGVDKVAGDVADVIMLGGMHEISVGRGEHEHLFVALAEVPSQLIERGDNAVGGEKILSLGRPAIELVRPVQESLKILGVKNSGISEDAAVKAGAHGVDNDLGSGKLHIGYPHADELVIGIGELHGLIRMENVLTEAVGIHTVGMSAVDYFIKIVFHSNTFPV